MGRIAYWRNHVVVTVLEAIGVAPKGTVDVHEMLFKTVYYLARGLLLDVNHESRYRIGSI
ncbi:putative methyltransferase [Helianthus debilis subsp. tardiflorus]